jgi:N-acetylmuramoyl-L-alanine amidase
MSFTSPDFLSAPIRQSLRQVQATAEKVSLPPTAVPTPFWANRIGVVAGHSGIATYGRTKGNVDPGALCPDGFTEASVTMKVAQQVVAILQGKGFTVDLLEEFDPQLPGYQAAAFISIHAQPCEDFGYGGFAIAYAPGRRASVHEGDIALAECVRQNYGALTGLEFQAGNITEDMTNYHAFSLDGKNISAATPGIVLELGFIGHDRDILQNHSDKLAQGVVNGLLCFLRAPSDAPTAVPQPLVPSPSPVIAPTATP